MELFPDQGERAPRRVSLVRLSAEIARSAAALGRVAVEGEVVDPRTRPSGRVYLTLRDRAARIGVVCPAARARRCRTVAGEQVRVTGRVEYESRRGRVQLVAEEVVPVGAGAVAAAIAEARERLEAEGLIGRPRRSLPLLPEGIGVVCGGGSAVREDIASVVAERFPGYPVSYVEVGVSGPGASEGIAEAVRSLESKNGIDVIVMARGGGDATELLAFSDEDLCRTIARCAVPVVSAIGHHGDRPLCDDVADHRFATPSLAANAVVPDEKALLEDLEGWRSLGESSLESRLASAEAELVAADPLAALDAGLAGAQGALDAASLALGLLDLSSRCASAGSLLHASGWSEAVPRRLDQAGAWLSAELRALEALDPSRVLDRGYAVVRTASGEVVRSAQQVRRRDALDVLLARGRLEVRVEGSDG